MTETVVPAPGMNVLGSEMTKIRSSWDFCAFYMQKSYCTSDMRYRCATEA